MSLAEVVSSQLIVWSTYIKGASYMTHPDAWKIRACVDGRNSTSGYQEGRSKKAIGDSG